MHDSVPLHLLVAAVRSHPPTAQVVPEWLVYAPSDDGDDDREHWYDDRHHDNPCPVLSDDAARLIFEASLWKTWNADPVYAVRWNEKITGAVVEMVDGEYHRFGDDLAAALAFACGAPLPDKETK